MAGRISEYFKIRKQEKEEFIAFLEDVKHKISVAGQEYQELFRNPSAYVDVRKTAEWKSTALSAAKISQILKGKENSQRSPLQP